MTDNDTAFMRRALELAAEAVDRGEVPIGAVVVVEGRIVAEAANEKEASAVATHHAEILAVERACQNLGRWRLSGATLYVTLEPCLMCAGALIQARIDRLVYGATDPKAGAVTSLYKVTEDPRLNHRLLVEGGVLAELCGEILSEFFRRKRQK